VIYPIQTAAETAQAGIAADGDSNAVSQAGTTAGTYTVVPGDNLWKISKKIYGHGWQWRKIYNANKDTLSSPEVLRAGQVLIIP